MMVPFFLKRKKNLATVTLIALILILPVSCKKEAEPRLDAGAIFSKVDELVVANYFFTDSTDYSPKKLYGAAMESLEASDPEPGRDLLIKKLQSYPPEEHNAKLYSALRAYVAALPEGYNEVIEASSLNSSNDPRKTAGTGMVLRKDGRGKFFLADVLESSPAGREHVIPGGYLKSVDGTPLDNIDDLETVVGMVKGQPDTELTVQVEDRQYKLIRGPAEMRDFLHATWKNSDGKSIEVIMLRAALNGTSNRLSDYILGLQGRSALVLDLRKLQSGSDRECFAIADSLMGESLLGTVIAKGKPEEKMKSDPDQAFTGKLYIITGRNSSALAQLIGKSLETREKTTFVGNPPPRNLFLSSRYSLPGGAQLQLTNGHIFDRDGKPMESQELHIDEVTSEFLPANPPLSDPDPADPAQKWIAEQQE